MGVNLVKGQKISLEKEAGGALQQIIMGLGWDAAKPKQSGGGMLGKLFGGGGSSDAPSIDLDASCLTFDEAGNVLETVWFRNLKNSNRSIIHTGDNTTGAGDGDDEQIIVELNNVPQNAQSLVFTVNSFRGQTFNEVENAVCRLVNKANNAEIAKFTISGGGSHTGMIMAKLYRHNGEWKLNALGEPCNGTTCNDMIPAIKSFL